MGIGTGRVEMEANSKSFERVLLCTFAIICPETLHNPPNSQVVHSSFVSHLPRSLLSVLFSEPDMGTDTLIQLGKG
jgi:hypothetical protein